MRWNFADYLSNLEYDRLTGTKSGMPHEKVEFAPHKAGEGIYTSSSRKAYFFFFFFLLLLCLSWTTDQPFFSLDDFACQSM